MADPNSDSPMHDPSVTAPSAPVEDPSQRARKRRRNEDDQADAAAVEAQLQTQQNAPRKKASQPLPGDPWHIPKKQVPDNASGLQVRKSSIEREIDTKSLNL